MRRIVLILLVVAGLYGAAANASEFPTFFEGVRPLGMGGAFTAVADDENALFYNPAGLDKVEEVEIAIVNPMVEGSQSSIDFGQDLMDVDTEVTSDVVDLLRDYMGENLSAHAAVFPHFVTKHFGLGILGQGRVNAKIDNPAYPEANVLAQATGSGHLGLGFGFLNGMVRVGGTVKYVHASIFSDVLTAAQIADPNFDQYVEDNMFDGNGVGFDAGVIVTAPLPLNPAIGLTVQNIGDLDLKDAGEVPQQVNVGASLTKEFGDDEHKWMKLIAAADWMDAGNAYDQDDDLYKRLHMGFEAQLRPESWYLPHLIALRTGLYQGYGTFGATLDFRLLKLDYANYAAEVGSYAGMNPDRRHVVQVSLGW